MYIVLLKKEKGGKLVKKKQVLENFTQNCQKLGDPVSVGVIQLSDNVTRQMQQGYKKMVNRFCILEYPQDLMFNTL